MAKRRTDEQVADALDAKETATAEEAEASREVKPMAVIPCLVCGDLHDEPACGSRVAGQQGRSGAPNLAEAALTRLLEALRTGVGLDTALEEAKAVVVRLSRH